MDAGEQLEGVDSLLPGVQRSQGSNSVVSLDGGCLYLLNHLASSFGNLNDAFLFWEECSLLRSNFVSDSYIIEHWNGTCDSCLLTFSSHMQNKGEVILLAVVRQDTEQSVFIY